jgi:hypothetical protein
MEFASLLFFRRRVLFLLPLALTLGAPFGAPSDKGSEVSSAPARSDGPAELPRVSMKSSLVDSPAQGKTWKLKPGDDFQAVLNRSACGDIVALAAGAVFTGNFTLPAKNCDDNHWIVVRTDAPDADLPPEGTRITPCFSGVASLVGRPAVNCSSIKTVTARLMGVKAGPLTLAPGANHYRIGPGLEITRPVGTGVNYALISKDANVPADHIIVDRSWVHGTAQDETTRGIFLSGVTYAAVVDSFFTDFHCTAGIGACTDSQAIAGGTGTLPQGIWKIENNFLEAAAENVMFGGNSRNSVTPADIIIRHNHLFKPLTWMPRPPQPGYVGAPDRVPTGCRQFDPNGGGQCPFIVKNLFELKNAQRVLFEGNILENAWAGFTQHGQSILIEGANTSLNATYSSVSVVDVTIRYNRISHTHSGFGITAPSGPNAIPNLPVARVSMHDDIFDDISEAYANADNAGGWALELLNCPRCEAMRDISINHITELLSNEKIFLVVGTRPGNPIQNFTYTNNIATGMPGLAVQGSGPKAPCAFEGHSNVERISRCVSPYTFTANALIGASDAWPQGNFFAHDIKDVKFINHHEGNGGDYHLSADSPCKRIRNDGKALGADVDAVEREIVGVQ